MEKSVVVNPYGFRMPVDELFAEKLCTGFSVAAAARECGLKLHTAYAKKNDPTFLVALRLYQDDVLAGSAEIKSRLEMSAGLAMDKLMSILTTSVNEELVVRTGFGLLDRSGHGPKQEIAVHRTIHLEHDDAQALETAFKEVKESGYTGKQDQQATAPSRIANGSKGEVGNAEKPGQTPSGNGGEGKALPLLPR